MRAPRAHASRSRGGWHSPRGGCFQCAAALYRFLSSLLVLFVAQGSLQAQTPNQLIRRCVTFCFAIAVFSALICVIRLSGLFARSCKGTWTTAAQVGERPYIAIVTINDTRRMTLDDAMYDMLGIDDPKEPLDILGLTWHNKQQYAQRHGYALINGSHLLDRTRPPSWTKLLIAMDTLQATPAPMISGGLKTPRRYYDWLLYLDADTVITNSDIKLEDLIPSKSGPDFVVPLEPAGVNAGAWFVRNSEWSRQFLQQWWSSSEFVRVNNYGRIACAQVSVTVKAGMQAPGDKSTKSGDNDALKYIVQQMDPVTRDLHIGMAPNCAFNSYLWRTSVRTLLRWLMTPTDVQQSIWQPGDFAVHLAGFVNKAAPLHALKRRGWSQATSVTQHSESRTFDVESSRA